MRHLLTVALLLLLCGCQLIAQRAVTIPATGISQSPGPEATDAEPAIDQPSGQQTAEAADVNHARRQDIDAVPRPAYQLPPAPELPETLNTYLSVQQPLPYYNDFPLSTHPRVERLIARYSGSQKRMFQRWLERATRYIPRIQLIFASEGLPLDLAYLAMIESGFNVRAYSWAHAAGPWQFIESTGRIYGLDNSWWRDERLDLEKATRAAAAHLKYLHKRFDGDWYLAVAAYNAGGGTVRRAIRESNSRDFWTLLEGRVLREETRNYIPKLLAALHIVRDLQHHGFADLEVQPPLAYETVILESSTDLEIIADFSDVSYKDLKELNPELKRWCTPPDVEDYRLRVPVGSAERVRALYARLPPDQRARYHRHQIRSGDTLQQLARHYRIRVDDIIALNQIRNPRALQIGENLILPLKEGFTRRPLDELTDSYVRSRRKTYRVRSGDSLWSIARRFSVSEKQLRVWNKLGWSNLLRPGQVLAVSRPNVVQVASRTGGTARKLVYKVVPGDTLWDIGRQFDVATDQIRHWNDLPQGHILQPGDKLTLLVTGSRRG